MMGVPMRKKCLNEEEEKKDVRVLGLPSYMRMLQRGRQDGNEEPITKS